MKLNKNLKTSRLYFKQDFSRGYNQISAKTQCYVLSFEGIKMNINAQNIDSSTLNQLSSTSQNLQYELSYPVIQNVTLQKFQLMNLCQLKYMHNAFLVIEDSSLFVINRSYQILSAFDSPFTLFSGFTDKYLTQLTEWQLHQPCICNNNIYVQIQDKILIFQNSLKTTQIKQYGVAQIDQQNGQAQLIQNDSNINDQTLLNQNNQIDQQIIINQYEQITIPFYNKQDQFSYYGKMFSVNGSFYVNNNNGQLFQYQNDQFEPVLQIYGEFYQFCDIVVQFDYQMHCVNIASYKLEFERIGDVPSAYCVKIASNGVIILQNNKYENVYAVDLVNQCIKMILGQYKFANFQNMLIIGEYGLQLPDEVQNSLLGNKFSNQSLNYQEQYFKTQNTDCLNELIPYTSKIENRLLNFNIRLKKCDTKYKYCLKLVKCIETQIKTCISSAINYQNNLCQKYFSSETISQSNQ
ncbi:Hypothetical_protein [Hexamita inflata]|uniref:Hypothetical_protein n=1 Tax=Hexamita inflata TaxID=28002 RepID=A0AA86NDV9_9EUKA|nr:Hypothetical protein HINF_LOCUS5188 [Hexamita inflata]